MIAARKTIDIEKLLTWTYREELPKAGAARALTGIGIRRAFRAIEAYGEYLTLIDCDGINRFGLVADLMAMREPHPDAVRVFEAVAALDEIEIVLPTDWDPLSDIVDIETERPAILSRALDKVTSVDHLGARILKGGPSRLIVRHAIMGGAPDWQADQPERKFEMGANGKPRWFRMIKVPVPGGEIDTEVDGMDRVKKRPAAGAYRKSYLDPDPVEAACDRAEYEVWRSAIDLLVDELDDVLEEYQPIRSSRPERPWEAPERAPVRVLQRIDQTPLQPQHLPAISTLRVTMRSTEPA